MFTVLSNTRNANLYLIVALAITLVVILSLAGVPSIAAPKPVVVPAASSSEMVSDYFQRHPELSAPAGITVDMTDYFSRHPELHQPATLIDLSDYFLRH